MLLSKWESGTQTFLKEEERARDRESHGSARIVEEDDRNTGRDDGTRVPLAYRDQCAHLLIPLNKCRQAEFYLPWKCENERHTYEKCAYELVMERMLQMQKIREEEAKSNQSKKQGIPLIPKAANA